LEEFQQRVIFCFFFYCGGFTLIAYNRIGGVMVSVLATRVVDHGFESIVK
jgi:hypothetical protein